MPENSRVLSVEFKVNFLNPAQGQHFRAEGRVIKPGKTLTICEGKMFALDDGQENAHRRDAGHHDLCPRYS